jgi:hypothetical protein
LVHASLFLTISIPRMNLASPKSVMQNCFPMARFADSIHFRESENHSLVHIYHHNVYAMHRIFHGIELFHNKLKY